jgi:hypothetical protein
VWKWLKKLAQIILDAPIQFKIEDCYFKFQVSSELVEFYTKLNFKSLLRRLNVNIDNKIPDTQLNLF